MWEGKILGPEDAVEKLGADAAFPSTPSNHFDEAFIAALAEADALYYRVGMDSEFDRRVFLLMSRAQKKLGRTGRPFWTIIDPDEVLGEMRLMKSKSEIARIQRACDITAEAHVNAMRITKPGMYEYEVEGVLYHAFRAQGAERVGYGSIVASGSNACVLHYVENSRQMADQDLLLIDAGAEYDYYTADITRVFPVGGKFTQEQGEIYGAVLKAQKECIAKAKPGTTLAAIHAHAVEVLTEELKRLKVLKGPTARLIKNMDYRAYYPHNTGHWLGMDVHDVGRYYQGKYSNYRKLQPGMVFTIEPGLYFGKDSAAPEKYKGIGVRIEDDILITAGGCKVLTSGVPKEIDEVESMCSQP
jgi:Xaa-Pro aminopeptidase